MTFLNVDFFSLFACNQIISLLSLRKVLTRGNVEQNYKGTVKLETKRGWKINYILKTVDENPSIPAS
jgi:hypothetical protein